MTGSHEVRGSIPLGSTNSYKLLKGIHRGCSLPFVCRKVPMFLAASRFGFTRETKDLLAG
jgi:hypothetical protein